MKSKIYSAGILLALLAYPTISFAKVSINEVAWMGTTESQYGEWLELYNDGAGAVDLKDAVLYEAGGTTQIIKLTKSIQSQGYYLIARSTPSMPDPVAGQADDLGSFGGSGLSNTGEHLVLKSATGEVLDSIDASLSKWPAGNSESKLTMQKSGGVWITATATPRVVNVSADSSESSQGSNDTAVTSTSNSNSVTVESFADLSVHSSPADLSSKVEESKVIASAGRNRLALVDTLVLFEEKLFNNKFENIDGGNVTWSFGDGQMGTGKVISHSYKFPGDYAVIMNVSKGADEYVARTNVRVVAPDLVISEATADFVRVKNQSSYEVNLGEWRIFNGRSDFTFPKDTILMQKGEITLSRETLGFTSDFDHVELFSPAKRRVSAFKLKKVDLVKPDNTAKVTSATSSNQASVAVSLLVLEQKLLEAKKSLELQTVKPPKVITTHTAVVVEPLGGLASKLKADIHTENKSEQPTTDIIQVIEKPKSIFRNILNAPVRGFRYLKGLIF
jgi:hypothetical protein